MQQQGHKISGHVVPFASQEEDTVVGFRAQLQGDLYVLVRAPQRGKGQPTGTGESRRADLQI